MNPNEAEQILQKLAKQQELLEKQAADTVFAEQSVPDNSVGTPAFELIHDKGRKYDSPDDAEEVVSTPDLSIPDRSNEPNLPRSTNVDSNNNKSSIVAERVRELTSKVHSDAPSEHKPTMHNKVSPYVDEYGEETFYVENLTNGNIVIPGIGIASITKGEVVDLLESADLETLKRSQFLKRALSDSQGIQLLRRLTPEQWNAIREKKKAIARRYQEQTKSVSPAAPQTSSSVVSESQEAIRPLVLSKVEKLRLGLNNDPEIATKGISKYEFLQWLDVEYLTIDELDYILGVVGDKEVRLHVYEKKQQQEGFK